MTNIKITQEARDLYDTLNTFHVQGDGYGHEWLDFEAVEVIQAAMQALINQTVEQAMVLVEFEAWDEKQVQASQCDGEDGPSWYNQAIEDAVKAIRTLKGN